MMQSGQKAPCPVLPLSLPAPHWDTRHEFAAGEPEALDTLAGHFLQGGKNWPSYILNRLSRLLLPLRDTLIRMHAARAPHNAAIHDIILEMQRTRKTYWAWTQEEWSDIICISEGEFRRRFGASGNCRQYVMALAWLLCGFDRLNSCGVFYQYRLCLKVFGRRHTDDAVSRLNKFMLAMGYASRDGRNNSVRNALCMAMLVQREPRPEHISVDTLRYIAAVGPAYLREASATLSRILASSGTIIDEGFDYRVSERRRPSREYKAVADVPAEWLSWCERWRATSVLRPSSVQACWYALLKCGRWLAASYPACVSPSDWTRETALAWVAAACKMKTGEWANPGEMYRERRGKLMKPSSRAGMLRHIRTLFHDLQEWGWIPVKFSPERVLRTPRSLSAQIGPAPRIVNDDIWCKLIHAGLNLQETDLTHSAGYPYFYPPEMIRALSALWLFGGLRRDEILRMRCGCIRWQTSEEDAGRRICLLDVPVSKTYVAFTKPVDPIVGEYIEQWENVRNTQPLQEDPKTGESAHFLFMHRGKRINGRYINDSLIPLLCKKAGIPEQDARGRITSHRARATIASQLYNAREPLDLFELQKWLGHASPESTRHYVDITPTRLASSLEKAGYFERNRRMVSVLIDQDAVMEGLPQEGKPWKYYDLGHGLCSYDFFDQCPHRMACAKCSFYLPKASSQAQYLEGRQNLLKLMQEIPLTDDEQAAVENDIGAVDRLLAKLSGVPAPEKHKK